MSRSHCSVVNGTPQASVFRSCHDLCEDWKRISRQQVEFRAGMLLELLDPGKAEAFQGLCVCVKSLQLCPTLCDPMYCSRQVPLSMGISRQEYWSGLLCPPPGDLPDPGIKPATLKIYLHWQVGSLPLVLPGKPNLLQQP